MKWFAASFRRILEISRCKVYKYSSGHIFTILRPKTKLFSVNTFRAAWFRRFSQKNSSFRLPYQRPSSSADCARELFSGSNGSASLVDYTRKKIFARGVQFFCEWCHKWRTFWPPWPTLPGPGRQPLGVSISLKFLLETGYNPSLLILWMTCWGFGFKSCDVS